MIEAPHLQVLSVLLMSVWTGSICVGTLIIIVIELAGFMGLAGALLMFLLSFGLKRNLSRLEIESGLRRVCDHSGGHWRGVHRARVLLLPYIIGNAKRTTG